MSFRYAQIANLDAYPDGEFTVAFWTKRSDTPLINVYSRLVGASSIGAFTGGWSIELGHETGSISVLGGGFLSGTAPSCMCHIALVNSSASGRKLYVNGVLVSSGSFVQTINGGYYYLGGKISTGAGTYQSVPIVDFRFFDSGLSDTDIADIYNNVSLLATTHWYKCTEGDGCVLIDYGSSPQNGKVIELDGSLAVTASCCVPLPPHPCRYGGCDESGSFTVTISGLLDSTYGSDVSVFNGSWVLQRYFYPNEYNPDLCLWRSVAIPYDLPINSFTDSAMNDLTDWYIWLVLNHQNSSKHRLVFYPRVPYDFDATGDDLPLDIVVTREGEDWEDWVCEDFRFGEYAWDFLTHTGFAANSSVDVTI